MATAPRRETMIALRARRTAHRVATDVLLTHRSRLIRKQCWNCREFFQTDRHDRSLCEHCFELERAHWPKPAEEERFHPAQNTQPRDPLKLRIFRWASIMVMFGVLIYGIAWSEFSTPRDSDGRDWTSAMHRITVANELKKTDPRAAIKEYEQIRESVEGEKIESHEMRKRLTEMDRSWAEAVRELSQRSATQP